MTVIPISKRLLREKDLFEELRFGYYADPERFVEAFNAIGIAINQSSVDTINQDLRFLADMNARGEDRKGTLKLKNGTPIIFNVREVMRNIDTRHDKLDNSGIKLTND